MTKQSYLIIGSGGRIGTHLTQKLVLSGATVRAVSRGATQQLEEPNQAIQLQLTPMSDFDQLLADIDVVIYLGDGLNRYEGIAPSKRDKNSSTLLSTIKKLAESAINNKTKLIYLSSIRAMCGSFSDEILTEQTETKPTCLYGQLKLEAEQILMAAASKTEAAIVILRVPVVFGMTPVGNLNTILQIARLPIPLPFNNIDSKRSFINIDNLVDALIAVSNTNFLGGEIFLVRDQSISVKELVGQIRNIMKLKNIMFSVPEFFWSFLCNMRIVGEKAERLSKPLEIDDSNFRRKFNWHPKADISIIESLKGSIK